MRFAIFEISHETKNAMGNGKRQTKGNIRNAVLLARRYTFKKFQGKRKDRGRREGMLRDNKQAKNNRTSNTMTFFDH